MTPCFDSPRSAPLQSEQPSGSTGERSLQQQVGTRRRAEAFYSHQVLDFLNERMQEFITGREMVFVATANECGECDCSFRAGPQGFVEIISENELRYPEYRGNGVMASLGNVVENQHIGMLFIDFFGDTIGLHVNGAARIVEDSAPVPAASPLEGSESESVKTPRAERWVLVTVHEAYIHCSKHIPSLAKVAKDIAWGTDDPTRKGGDYFGAKWSKLDCQRDCESQGIEFAAGS